MKKLLLASVFGLLVFQTESHAFLRLGLKAGLNYAKASSDNGPSYKRTPGYSIGGAADLAVTPATSLRADLLWIQKNSKFSYPLAGQPTNGQLKLEQVVFAPFFVLRAPSPKVIPFLQIGPEVGFYTRHETTPKAIADSIGARFKSEDYSLNIGAGIILPFGVNDLTLDARYNIGLVNVDTDNRGNGTKTNAIQIFLGYNFFKI